MRRGSLEDLDSLRGEAAAADGVVHTAYIHDFSPTGNPAAAAQTDGRAIEAIGTALAGTGKPLVVAAGIVPVPGRVSTEEDAPLENPHIPRVSEPTALALAGRGVRVSVVRLPPSVHGQLKSSIALTQSVRFMPVKSRSSVPGAGIVGVG